jgi:hypothetical protein
MYIEAAGRLSVDGIETSVSFDLPQLVVHKSAYAAVWMRAISSLPEFQEYSDD